MSPGRRHVRFRFHAELNDFLAPERRGAEFEYSFELPASVKDMIESLGVPHTEIAEVLINGKPSGFSTLITGGEIIDVSPAQTRPSPPGPRFVLDIHLGRLATYLRMAGFDTLYRNDYRDEELAEISAREQRILLTQDRGLLKRGIVEYGYYVRSHSPREQFREVVKRYNLFPSTAPLTRCLECNSLLQPVQKHEIADRLPAMTKRLHNEFRICPRCGRIYWKGSHYEHMRKFLDLALSN